MQRILELEGVRNLRDLGGLATRDGRRVAAGRLFRSGSLHEMTAADRASLAGLGIRVVVDLRSAFEQGRHPYDWRAGRKVSAPLADDDSVAEIFSRFQTGGLSPQEVEDWWRLTGVFDCPSRHAGSLRVLFATLLAAGPQEAVLFHCTGGKDRAGVAAALLLEGLGVAREGVLADFLLSNRDAEARAAEFIEWMRRATGWEMSPQAAYWLAGVKAEWLETLLRGLEGDHGSVEGYLQDALGIGPQERAALRAKYLEPQRA